MQTYKNKKDRERLARGYLRERERREGEKVKTIKIKKKRKRTVEEKVVNVVRS